MTDKHEHLDEGTIHAWLDGALPPDESARIERWAGACAECATLVAEARGLVAASSRILSSLDAVPGGVIPGADTGVDQLAALRARRREASRRWWSDRRIVAAASLAFVAGVSSLVLRNAGDDAVVARSASEADAVATTSDSAVPATVGPSAAPLPAPPRASDAPTRNAKAETTERLRDAAQPRLAERRAMDSAIDRKVAANQALTRRDSSVANEVGRADEVLPQRAVDSIAAARVATRSTLEAQLQQGAASQRQQSLRPRAESPAAPPSIGGAGSRLGSVVTTGVAAAAPTADMAQAIGCYRLQRSETERAGPAIIADSVQLLADAVRERSDPAWYRARAAGSTSDTSFVWRSVDSTTVEVRSRLASNPFSVRFSTAGLPLPLVSDAGVRAVVAVRIRCN